MKKTSIAYAVALAAFSINAHSAVYDIEVLPENNLSQNVFAQSIDESGYAIATLQNQFNQPIDITLIDFEDENLLAQLTDPDAAASGNFNEADYTLIINNLRASSQINSSVLQRLAVFRSHITDGVQTTPVVAFDEINSSFNALSQSPEIVARDSVNGDFIIGSAEDVFYPLDFTTTTDVDITYVINDFRTRAFVQVGNTVTGLPGPFDSIGGRSIAYTINNNFQVAGEAIALVNENVQTALDRCADDDLRGDQPLAVCNWRLNYPTSPSSEANDISILQAGGQSRAMIWQVSTDGTLVDSTTYGLIFEPEEDDVNLYNSRARDINDAGMAVGVSSTGELVTLTRPGNNGFASQEAGSVAVTFANGQITEILNRDDHLQSVGIAINNNNWVAGISAQEISNVARNKLFVSNLDSNEERIVGGFFSSSITTPRAMNNNNIVVGEADVEVTNDTIREKNAFMYNIDTDEFININSLIACDSPYTLIDAVDINDNNEIVVNARAREPLKDLFGNDVLDETGEPIIIDTVVALKLNPIANGEPSDCDTEEDIFIPAERQGASISTLFLGVLAALIAFRRRYAIS